MADKRVTRAVYGVFVTLAAAFILSSVWQIASQLFGFGSASRPEAPRPPQACMDGLRKDVDAVDRGIVAASGAKTGDEAELKYREVVAGQTAAAEPCGADPAGREALAALARYDRAAAASLRRQGGELGSVRREVESFIR